ncbi:MAG: EamA family transporter [Elusimicrobia bacterium]|nr:EamA family transporter [Elusimicrobiota bacterium]
MTLSVIILLLITALLWGSTPVIEKVALQTTDPLVGLTIRSVFIAAILALVCAVSGKWPAVFSTPLRDKFFFGLSGFMAGLLGMFTYYLALRVSPSSRVVPIAAAYPLFAAVLGAIFLREEVTLVRVLGTVFIVAGVWLVK